MLIYMLLVAPFHAEDTQGGGGGGVGGGVGGGGGGGGGEKRTRMKRRRRRRTEICIPYHTKFLLYLELRRLLWLLMACCWKYCTGRVLPVSQSQSGCGCTVQ